MVWWGRLSVDSRRRWGFFSLSRFLGGPGGDWRREGRQPFLLILWVLGEEEEEEGVMILNTRRRFRERETDGCEFKGGWLMEYGEGVLFFIQLLLISLIPNLRS